ncbi:ATP-dependent DNA helicase DinG [Escherichia coli ECA-727]|nr:ATP-dependent DNA helicase DinG [Escherichia coli ECA-727]
MVITEGEWLKSLNRYPFEVQSLPSASFNLIQQVGRLIRSHGCWGEVVIYDKRLLNQKLWQATTGCITGISDRATGSP